MIRTYVRFLAALIIMVTSITSATANTQMVETKQASKLRIGVVGLTHTHVHWIFESEKSSFYGET